MEFYEYKHVSVVRWAAVSIFFLNAAVFMSYAAEVPDAQEPSVWCCAGLF